MASKRRSHQHYVSSKNWKQFQSARVWVLPEGLFFSTRSGVEAPERGFERPAGSENAAIVEPCWSQKIARKVQWYPAEFPAGGADIALYVCDPFLGESPGRAAGPRPTGRLCI
jgi:hypothetical protein